MRLVNQVGFFDLDTLLQFAFDINKPYDLSETGQNNEEQQIEEIAQVLEKYSDDIFMSFQIVCTLILDRVWIISKPNVNGRLSMDNRPLFTSNR